MTSCEHNYAFIDGQNMHKGTMKQGWLVDYGKLRAYLRDAHQVEKAYIFIGRVRENEFLYRKMEKKGFNIIFKEVTFGSQGMIKGNCDSDMAVRICMDFWNFDKAVIISGDGDFYFIGSVLHATNKLGIIVAPNVDTISKRYYRFGREKIMCLDEIKDQIIHNVLKPITNEKAR